MMDFSQEADQATFKGLIPPHSCVMAKLFLLYPQDIIDNTDPAIHVTKSGLYMLRVKWQIVAGTYIDNSFYDWLTLPESFQRRALNDKQKIACRIGGAQIKAILKSAKKPLQINSFSSLQGLTVVIKVQLSKEPHEYQGKWYWSQDLERIMVPEDNEYAVVMRDGELLSGEAIPPALPPDGYQATETPTYYGTPGDQDQSFFNRFAAQEQASARYTHPAQTAQTPPQEQLPPPTGQEQVQVDKVPF